MFYHVLLEVVLGGAAVRTHLTQQVGAESLRVDVTFVSAETGRIGAPVWAEVAGVPNGLGVHGVYVFVQGVFSVGHVGTMRALFIVQFGVADFPVGDVVA